MKASFLAGVVLAMAMAAPAAAVPADFKARADALLKASFPATGPGAVVIVSEDGKTVYEAGRGLADVADKRPITPATVFRLGSITKQFAAAIVLQLATEGKLSLDDKVSKFLPGFPQPGADATVAQLLNHTVGIQSYTVIPGWLIEANTNRAYSTEQMVAVFKDLPAPFKPGEKWDYNNSGYVLVGAVIEKVTGMPWHQAVDERIAKPLGLTTIRYGMFENEMPNMAAGYTLDDGKTVPAKKMHMSVPHAAGALIGSVGDLAKWNAALHSGKIVPQPFYLKMIARTPLPDGSNEDYGFGISNREVRGHAAIGHGGGIYGFLTDSIYLPKDDLFVAVFVNSDQPTTSPGKLLMQLTALAAGNPFPTFTKATLDSKKVASWVGVYPLKGGERRVYLRDGKLFTQRSGGGELEVHAASDGRYYYPGSLTWFELKRGAGGTPTMAVYQEESASPELSSRSGPIPLEPKAADVPRATLQSYAGSYSSAIGPIKIDLPAQGPMTAQLAGQDPIAMAAISATEYRTVGADARVVFRLEGDKVAGLVLHQGGREMPAKKD